MAVTTKFEARFFVVTEPYNVWFVGRIGNSIDVATSVLHQRQPVKFFDDLVDECIKIAKFNEPTIKLVIDKSTKYRVSFDTAEKGLLLIDIWVGCCNPKFEIDATKPYMFSALEHGRGLRDGYFYILSSGSHMEARQPTLFLTLVNHYVQTCTDKELKQLTDKKEGLYLRCQFAFEDETMPPGALVAQREINKCNEDYQTSLNKCPTDYVPCELLRSFMGYFIFVKRDRMLKRETITKDDIILAD